MYHQFVARAAALLVAPFSLGAPSMPLDEARAILVARLARLQNLVVRYHQFEEYAPKLKPITIEGMNVQLKQAARGKSASFWYLAGKVRYETRIDEAFLPDVRAGIINEPPSLVIVFPGDRIEKLLAMQSGAGYYGNIRNDAPLPLMIIDFALGLRQADANGWLGEQQIMQMDISIGDESPRIVIAKVADRFGTIHKWSFDRDQGFALVSYTLQSAERDYVSFEIANEAFRNVDGVILPMHIEKRQYLKKDGGDLKTLHTITIDVDEYQIGDSGNGDDKYRILWPADIMVHDARRPAAYRTNANGELIEWNPGADSTPQRDSWKESEQSIGKEAENSRQILSSKRLFGRVLIAVGALLGVVAFWQAIVGRRGRIIQRGHPGKPTCVRFGSSQSDKGD